MEELKKIIMDSFCFSKKYGWSEDEQPDTILYYRHELKKGSDFIRKQSSNGGNGKRKTTLIL